MSDASPGVAPLRVRLSEWISIAGLVVALAGMVWVGGGYVRQLDDDTRRIEALEMNDAKRGDTLAAIDVRTARLEAKIDFMMSVRGRTQ